MRTLGLKRLPVAIATAVAVVILGGLLSLRNHPSALAALWSVTIIASLVGWGSLVNLWLTRERWLDWGLRAGWGMAFFVLTGGFLCVTHLAIRPVIVTQIGLGVMALLGTWAHRWRPVSATQVRHRAVVTLGRGGLVALVAAAYSMAAFALVASLGSHSFQPSDDPPFYFTLPESLVQTGSMFEPYAARRASSFGGQVYLHATFISVAPIYYLHAVDAGISLVVVVGLLVGYVGRAGLKPWHGVPIGLAMLVLFTLHNVRVNTASLMSGVAGIVTLYRTVRVPLGRDPARPTWPIEPRRVAALAGIAVVCILMRTSNAAAVLPFVVLVFLADYLLGARRPWALESLRSVALTGAIFSGVFVLALAPWSFLMEQSAGTFFFPFGKNNITPGWTFLTHPASLAGEFVVHLFHGRPVAFFVPFAIAGLVPLAGPRRNDVAALTIASIVGLVAQAWQSAAFGPVNTARYYFAYFAATALVVAISVDRSSARTAFVAAAVAVHLALSRDETRDTLSEWIRGASSAISESVTDHDAFDAGSSDYVDIQSHVPAGASMVTAVFEPFRFDFKRNRIMILDFLGGMGPKPGWPLKQGPEALGEYLVANGVDYLVWVDFNSPHEFYNKAHWKGHLGNAGHYLYGEAIVLLDAEDSIEKLTAMRQVTYRAHGITVVDLRAPAPD